MGQTVVQTVEEYLYKHPKSSLTTLDVILNQSFVIQNFAVAMTKAIKKKDSPSSRKIKSVFQTVTNVFRGKIIAIF